MKTSIFAVSAVLAALAYSPAIAADRGGHGAIHMGGGGGAMHGAHAGRSNFIASGPRVRHNFANAGHGGNWNGAWNDGGGRHHGRHFHGGTFFAFGSPYYDNYYDDAGDGGCGYYYSRWRHTGSPYWRNRYYDCVG